MSNRQHLKERIPTTRALVPYDVARANRPKSNPWLGLMSISVLWLSLSACGAIVWGELVLRSPRTAEPPTSAAALRQIAPE